MGNTPVSNIYHKPGKMSEEVDYALGEMKDGFNVTEKKIENKISIEDLNLVLNILESKYADKTEVLVALNLLSTKVENLILAIQTLTDKLDAEDVASLDTNYRSTIDTIIE